MMKKYLFAVLILLLTLALCSCFRAYNDIPMIPVQETSEPDGTSAAPEETSASETFEETSNEETTMSETSASVTTALYETTYEAPESETVTQDIQSIVDKSDENYSYSDMEADLSELAEAYPERFTFKSLGKTHEGREIYAGTIGSESAEKRIVITAATHAREYITTKVLMAQVENILANSETAEYNGKTFSEILKNYAITVIPMLNPDGVMLVQEGISSLSTDEAKETVNSIYSTVTTSLSIDEFIATNWKSNAMGVDINRNAPCAGWETNEPGAIAPYFKNYKGASAGSELETQAFVNYVNSTDNIVFVAAYHTAGHVIYWNCGAKNAIGDTAKALSLLSQKVTDSAGLKYTVRWDEYFDSSLTDWCVRSEKIPAITVEMCDVNYPIPDSEFDSAYKQTLYLIPAYAEYFNQ